MAKSGKKWQKAVKNGFFGSFSSENDHLRPKWYWMTSDACFVKNPLLCLAYRIPELGFRKGIKKQ